MQTTTIYKVGEREFSTYEEARKYEVELEEARVKSYNPAKDISIFEKNAERTLARVEYPVIVRQKNKYDTCFYQANDETDLYKIAFNIMKMNDADFFYDGQDKVAVDKMIETKNGLAAFYYIFYNRQGYEYEEVEFAYFQKIKEIE